VLHLLSFRDKTPTQLLVRLVGLRPLGLPPCLLLLLAAAVGAALVSANALEIEVVVVAAAGGWGIKTIMLSRRDALMQW
jgi:hypothetical protein